MVNATYDNPKVPNPTTPDVVVCGGEWHGVEAEGLTYRQWDDAPGLVIIAQPEPGWYLDVPEGSLFGQPVGDAAGAAWTDDLSAMLEQPCTTEPTQPGEQTAQPSVPYVPPVTELPATGADVVGMGIAVALLVAGALCLVWVHHVRHG